MLDFLRKSQTFLVYGFLGVFLALSSLHLFIGYADNGDFTRSVAFIFEKPYGFSAMWPPAETEEFIRRFHFEWHDKWVFLKDWPDESQISTYSSYKLYLLAQVWISALLAADENYSIIVGSIFSRLIFLSAFLALFRKVGKGAPAPIFWLFMMLASAVATTANWTAFFNSFYEEQIAIMFLPVAALLLYQHSQNPSLRIGWSALACATMIGSSKTACFYLPIMMAPFLFPLYRGKRAALKFALTVALCQSIAFLPVYFGKYKKVNQYHAVYYGALKLARQIDGAENITMIGNKPVVRECVGVPFFDPAGEACLQKTDASYGDVARLVYQYPKIGFAMIAQVFSEGSHIALPILGKKLSGAPDFSGMPIFNVVPRVFSKSFNWVFLVLNIIAFPVFFRAKKTASLACGSMLKPALFLSLFGFSQYAIVLGDGFFETIKHLALGNYSLALSFAFFLPGLLLLGADHFRGKRAA
jgi:hypothetical protein